MPRPEETPPLGISIGEIVDRTTKIVQEEIELAKTEMAVAAQDLLRGSVAGIVGGVFAFFGIFVLLIAVSFLIADAIGAFYPWLGFFIVAFLCFSVGLGLALLAMKKIKKGSQIVPTQALDEAKQTREALKSEIDKDKDSAIDSIAVEEPAPTATPVPAATKPQVEAAVASKPAAPTADEPAITPATPAGAAAARPASTGTTDEVLDVLDVAAASAAASAEEAIQQADAAGGDAREAKRLAKQEAKEAREAQRAAAKAEKEAEKAEKLAEKRAKKAAKLAAKQAKKGGSEAGIAPFIEERDVLGQPIAPQDYMPPHPPEEPPAPPADPDGKS